MKVSASGHGARAGAMKMIQRQRQWQRPMLFYGDALATDADPDADTDNARCVYSLGCTVTVVSCDYPSSTFSFSFQKTCER